MASAGAVSVQNSRIRATAGEMRREFDVIGSCPGANGNDAELW